MDSRAAQLFNQRGKIGDVQNDSVPTTGLLTMAVGHRTRARRARSTQEKVKMSERDFGEGRKLLNPRFESKLSGIERDGATDIADLIANAMKSFYQAGVLRAIHNDPCANRRLSYYCSDGATAPFSCSFRPRGSTFREPCRWLFLRGRRPTCAGSPPWDRGHNSRACWGSICR